jgi:hypothetical protein
MNLYIFLGEDVSKSFPFFVLYIGGADFMKVRLYDINKFGKKITRQQVEQELSSERILELLVEGGWYIDTMRNADFIDNEKSAFRIKDIWFDGDTDILHAEIEPLDNPIAAKLCSDMRHVKFVMKGFVKRGELNLIGFGYCYQPFGDNISPVIK